MGLTGSIHSDAGFLSVADDSPLYFTGAKWSVAQSYIAKAIRKVQLINVTLANQEYYTHAGALSTVLNQDSLPGEAFSVRSLQLAATKPRFHIGAQAEVST